MGHVRLGELARTRKWQQVVALLEAGAGVSQLANATMYAAQQGLNFAAKDKGVQETIWLLTQLPLAARSDDFVGELRKIGLQVSDNPGLMEIVGAFSDAIDARLTNNNGRTDLGEMAQTAASQTLTETIGARMGSLFESNAQETQTELAKLGTQRQFSIFAKDFFGRVTDKYLNYFLDRAYAHNVGEGQRFTTLKEQSNFKEALRLHCHEASVIVEEFSGGWFSKTNWERGEITRENAAGFTAVAMKKLISELQAGAESHDE